MNIPNLYRYLHDAPFRFQAEFPTKNAETKKAIVRECARHLFPAFQDARHFLTPAGLAALHLDQFSSSSGSLPDIADDAASTVCGHVFRKGETIYRCKTCGLDGIY
jgi:hypothetical protein